MKRVALLIGLILTLSFISAAGIDVKLNKNEFYQGEILQAEILGTFTSNLKAENIAIYKGDAVHSTPAEEGLLKLKNKYLYYAVIPSTTGDYSLKIENIEYYIGQEKSEETILQNFTITSTTDPYLTFDKGFISTTQDFTLKIKSMNAVQEVTAKLEETGEEITQELGYNIQDDFDFSIQGITNYTETKITIGDYSIPVYITPTSGTIIKERYESLEELIRIYPSTLNATVLPYIDYPFQILITNNANRTLDDFEITSDLEDIKINPNSIAYLLKDEKIIIDLTVNFEKATEGIINITRKGAVIQVPLNVKIAEEKEQVDISEVTIGDKTCSEIGFICKEGETCEGTVQFVQGDICCIGSCKSESKGSSSWIGGILILLILIGVGWFGYTKYKQQSLKNKAESSEKKIKESSDRFKQRTHPALSGPEVRKGLDRV